MMFDHDRSATRGTMSPRGIYVFSHADAFGSAPAHTLTERITARLGSADPEAVPRHFSDYAVTVDDADLPSGITLTRLLG